MNQSWTEPEFSVEESEKMRLTENRQDYSNRILVSQVAAELKQLSQELELVITISRKIRDSLLVLEQSLEEQ